MFKTLRTETTSRPCWPHSCSVNGRLRRNGGCHPPLTLSYELILWRVVLEKQQVVSFDGRINVDNSNEMREKLGAALKLKPGELMVDLSQVTSIDKSGVATLVEATRIARRQDTRLMITGLQGQP